MSPIEVIQPPPDAAYRPGTMPGLSASRVRKGKTLSAVLVTLAPGGQISPHSQATEEVQHIISGTGVARDAARTETPVGPGAIVFCPGGEEGAHSLLNTGSEPLRLLIVYANAPWRRAASGRSNAPRAQHVRSAPPEPI